MAFQSSAPARTTSAPANEGWKAQGFINLYLPAKEAGKRRKLGYIALHDNKPAEKILLDWLMDDPARVAKLMDSMIMEFQSADTSDKSGFALPE